MQVLIDLLETALAFLAEVAGLVVLALVLGRSWRGQPPRGADRPALGRHRAPADDSPGPPTPDDSDP